MPNPRRKHSKAKVGKSRTHKKLEAPTFVKCDSCGETKQPHRVCPSCGEYKGETVVASVTS